MYQNIGAIIDKLIFFGCGIYFIVLSIKNREKLGNKVAMVRFSGILLILIGIVFTIKSILQK
jgi:hypothetical protein